jgi:hypothetical protein
MKLNYKLVKKLQFTNILATDVQLARRCARLVQSENGVVAG